MANPGSRFLLIATTSSIIFMTVYSQNTGLENSQEMALLTPETTPEPRRSCEGMNSCDVFDIFERKCVNLERRIRSLEQPGTIDKFVISY